MATIDGEPLSTDLTLVLDRRHEQHPAWPFFVREMQGRAYGSEAVNTAWAWFKRGWEAEQ